MKLTTPLLLAFLLLSGTAFAGSCFESVIRSPAPFMGNNEEVFKLDDGSIWEVKYEYSYMYAYYPEVIVCPNKNKIYVNDKALNVEMIKPGNTSGKK